MDKPRTPISRFVSRYFVTIVMVPAIIALHIGWSSLQKNRSLVQEHEEIDLPVVTLYKYCLKRLGVGYMPEKNAAVKAESS